MPVALKIGTLRFIVIKYTCSTTMVFVNFWSVKFHFNLLVEINVSISVLVIGNEWETCKGVGCKIG